MVWYSIFIPLLELFKLWGFTIFVIPFVNLSMLWILVPVWFSWFFAEFFQEKTGTSLGNAITNATIIIWAAIDCTRQTVSLISSGTLTGTADIVFRFILLSLLLIYGIVILVLGWKGNALIKKIGRIRETTYIFAIFVPVFYNFLPLTFQHLLAAILFFPLFYFTVEFLDWIIPDPKAIEIDAKDAADSEQSKQAASSPDPLPQSQPAQPNPAQPGLLQQNQYPRQAQYQYPRRHSDFWNFKF